MYYVQLRTCHFLQYRELLVGMNNVQLAYASITLPKKMLGTQQMLDTDCKRGQGHEGDNPVPAAQPSL